MPQSTIRHPDYLRDAPQPLAIWVSPPVRRLATSPPANPGLRDPSRR